MSKLFAVGLLVIMAVTTLAQFYPNNAVKNSKEPLDRHMMLNSASAQDNAPGMSHIIMLVCNTLYHIK